MRQKGQYDFTAKNNKKVRPLISKLNERTTNKKDASYDDLFL